MWPQSSLPGTGKNSANVTITAVRVYPIVSDGTLTLHHAFVSITPRRYKITFKRVSFSGPKEINFKVDIPKLNKTHSLYFEQFHFVVIEQSN